ncbi:MAG: MmcQ/YjbR family DNA-binding protein [Psychrobium sp.]|nr:MmcQ/YjbR family DNA-binding protein [Psychrobium sp.]
MEFLKKHLLAQRYCLVDYPFGRDIMVFKVKGKMFATLGKNRINHQLQLNLKCDPNEAMSLRGKFPAIISADHISKHHWNTVILDGSLPQAHLLSMVDNSYVLVVETLPKKIRALMD